MNGKKYIFFDLGWTLEDETEAQVDRAKKAVLASKEFGIETTTGQILELQEEGAKLKGTGVFPYAIYRLALDEMQQKVVLRKAWWDKTLLSLYPDTWDVVERLNAIHFIGLIANQSPGAEIRLKSYGIHQFFDLIFASAELGLSKPDQKIFRLAQERAGCSPGQAWMIGDRLDNDIKPAMEIGWKTIRILHGYNRKQQPDDESEMPDYTISELTELLEILL